MAKWAGKIGFSLTVEEPGSVWKEQVIEKPYTGEVIHAKIRNDIASEKINDDIHVNHEISIVADSFALNNAHTIKYVTFLGARWKVTSITDPFPRLTLSIGGVYNGPEPDEE